MLKNLLIVPAAIILLTITACSSTTAPVTTSPVTTSPTTPTPTPPSVTACAAFDTIEWAIPLVEDLLLAGKLTPQEQAILTDAQKIVTAGCNPSNTTLLAQIDAAAAELVLILYPAAAS